MEPWVVALVVANVVISLAVAAVVLLRRSGSSASGADVRQDLRAQRSELSELLQRDRDERQVAHRELREDLDLRLDKVRESVDDKLRLTLTTSLKENADRIEALTKANADKHIELLAVLRDELEKMRAGNETKLEKMRETVDEKLQGTLEKRLGESFLLVSTRLEEVHKGLGEMQSLAGDVGGLKRVLANVKNRGVFGEARLGAQLEDLLTRDQYEENVAVKPGSAERVEFAVKLPGREDGIPVYLPIDSKFPQEDYERLLNAQDAGDKAAVELAARNLERAIIEQAKLISTKYIEPPHTTDFAILYLPTEGLFAEVVRLPGLTSKLQSTYRVMVTGPTTLMSLLNSLQMGFKTLAIEKRSSEVWQVLAAAKDEFRKYGQVWARLEKQLQTAQNTVADGARRTRAVERKLRSVESEPLALGGDVFDELLDEVTDSSRNVFDEHAALDQLDGIGREPIDSSLVDGESTGPETGSQIA